MDAYQTLECPVNASLEHVRKQYKRLALKHHPDKNVKDPNATHKFQLINSAYSTIARGGEDQESEDDDNDNMESHFNDFMSENSGFYQDEMMEDFFSMLFGGHSFDFAGGASSSASSSRYPASSRRSSAARTADTKPHSPYCSCINCLADSFDSFSFSDPLTSFESTGSFGFDAASFAFDSASFHAGVADWERPETDLFSTLPRRKTSSSSRDETNCRKGPTSTTRKHPDQWDTTPRDQKTQGSHSKSFESIAHQSRDGSYESNNNGSERKSAAEVTLGLSVRVRQHLMGIVRYIGPTDYASGTFIGVELKPGQGKNDGTIKGRCYFSCPSNSGLMVRLEEVDVI